MERDTNTSKSPVAAATAAMWDALLPLLASVRSCEAVASAGAWSYALVGQCFSRMRRVQFDEEHQRSLLSCHSTDESSSGSRTDSYTFSDDAMLELRRRVMRDDSLGHKPTFAKDIAIVHPMEYPLPTNHKPLTRWEKRKADALARKLQAEHECRSSHTHTGAIANDDALPAAAFSMLLSETERALDDILLHTGDDAESHKLLSSVPFADDVRRLSVDELLAPRKASSSTSSTRSTCSSTCSPTGRSSEKTTAHGVILDSSPAAVNAVPSKLSPNAQALRQWLAALDPPRASEYDAYASCFEAQGFASLRDLRELAPDEIEQAMSEVGVAKFAHRARLRKAIVRLCRRSANAMDAPASDNDESNESRKSAVQVSVTSSSFASTMDTTAA